MKLSGHFRNYSLRTKLIIAFSLLLLGTVSVVSTFFGYILLDNLKSNTLQSRYSVVKSTLDMLDERLRSIDEQIYNITGNYTLISILEKDKITSEENTKNIKLFQENLFMSIFGASSSYLDSVVIIGKNGSMLYSPAPPMYNENSYEHYAGLSQMKQASAMNGQIYWFFSKGDVYQDFEPLPGNNTLQLIGVRKIQTWNSTYASGYREWGYVVYKLSNSFLWEFAAKMNLFNDEAMAIFDSNNNLYIGKQSNWSMEYIANSIQNLISTRNEIHPINTWNKNHIVLTSTSGYTHLGIAMLKSYSSIMEEAKKLIYFMIFAIIIMFLASVFLAIIISNGITRPLKKIISKMNEVGKGNFNVSISITRQDEMGKLAAHYNLLIENIRKLFEQEKESQKKIRKAELKALQSQIQPHFLYNTLDMIYNSASLSGDSRTASLLISFSSFFRLSLNSGRDTTTIQREMEHVGHYLKLQKARYNDAFEYQVVLDESVMDHPCLPLIVQPLVENSLVHGIMKGEAGDSIVIDVQRMENGILIRVEDNGIGFDTDKMQKLIDTPAKEGQSYGLRNIQERIRLFAGESYGLSFSTPETGGSQVSIMFPYIEE